MAQIQNRGESEFIAFLEQQKKSIVEYHLQNNHFYREIVGDKSIENWQELPILLKSDLQIPLEKRLSNGFNVNNVYVNKTSGSSGEPFVFAKDKFCHAMTWATIQNRFGWHGLDFNTSKQARFYGIPLDKKAYYKERLKDSLSKRYRFSVFDLSDSAFENWLIKFKKTDFEYLNGYTSSIVQFAKFLFRKNMILSDVCPSLKACVVTSEMLFDQDRELITHQFGIPIINEYGASELDLIAFENLEGEWQMNNETLYVEILDDNNMVLPNGAEGRVVITSLFNQAHPFIRYDIGDRGIISEKSTLKKPLLKQLVGRADDIIRLPSGKRAAGLTFYYVTKSVIDSESTVKEFVIEQLDLSTFKINYSAQVQLSESHKKNIKKEIENYLEPGLNILFKREQILDRSQSGKLKQFKSNLMIDE